jgi:hypothetical protein
MKKAIKTKIKLKTSNKNKSLQEIELSPFVKSLIGVVKLPGDFDYKKVLFEEINKKYYS